MLMAVMMYKECNNVLWKIKVNNYTQTDMEMDMHWTEMNQDELSGPTKTFNMT